MELSQLLAVILGAFFGAAGWLFVGLYMTRKANEREARTHPRKNVLNQALGAGHQIVEPHFGAVSCQEGDRFLLCTDGVIDGIWDQRLGEFMASPVEDKPRATRIVEHAVNESGRDNCTAVVVEFS